MPPDPLAHASRQLSLWQALQTCDGWVDFLLPRISALRDHHANQQLDNEALTPEQREAARNKYLALRDLLNDLDSQAQQHVLTLANAKGGQVPPEFSGLLSRAQQARAASQPASPGKEMNVFDLMGNAGQLQQLAKTQPILQEVMTQLGIGGNEAKP